MLPDLGVASQPGDRQEQAGGSRGAGRASDGRCSQLQSIRRAPGVLLLPNPRFRLQHVAHRGLLQHSFLARRVDIVNGVRAVTGTMTGFIYDHVYTNFQAPDARARSGTVAEHANRNHGRRAGPRNRIVPWQLWLRGGRADQRMAADHRQLADSL